MDHAGESVRHGITRLARLLGLVVGTACVMAMVGCSVTPLINPSPAQTRVHAADEVAAWMTGSYANTAQAQLDPDEFYDQHLHIVEIWPERDDGPWLYVEQVLARRPDTPFRQRVERLSGAADGSVLLEIFALPDPLIVVGAWRRVEPLAEVARDDLIAITGCDILLHLMGSGEYEGTTIGHGCASTRLGAAYASSAFRLTPDLIEIWDRGFDELGRQVWGSLTSGYVFDKLAD